jgi:hypothetical protein
MPVSGAVNEVAAGRLDQRRAGEDEEERRQEGEEGRDARRRAPGRDQVSAPNSALVQPPTKPTKATTMISGPGVVSPSARPSIICVPVSHW